MLPQPSVLFGPNIRRGPRGEQQIALTFDDGPSEMTPGFLELLAACGVHATFFQCGANVVRLPTVARQVRDAGHEIGNHTYWHPRLSFCTPARIRQEIGDTQQAIAEATGLRPRFFRAPYGLPALALRGALQQHGMTSVLWTVIGYDWVWEAEEIADHVVSHASNGGIICLHDGDRAAARPDRRRTLAALRQILPRLRDRGFSFVTAGEMVDQMRSGRPSL